MYASIIRDPYRQIIKVGLLYVCFIFKFVLMLYNGYKDQEEDEPFVFFSFKSKLYIITYAVDIVLKLLS